MPDCHGCDFRPTTETHGRCQELGLWFVCIPYEGLEQMKAEKKVHVHRTTIQ
jgi:hypothetical protein